MKYIATIFLALFLVGCQEMTTHQIYNKVVDGTVAIEIQMADGKGGMGTGFIVGENKIITNNHVTEHDGKLFVRSPNSQKKYEAVVVATDKISDLSWIKLSDWDGYKKNEHPTFVKLGDSDRARVGDKIIVIGHPWGLEWSVSEGIISAKNRRIDSNPKFLDQVDAHLYQGNSGGPIFNAQGQVVCVSNIMVSREGGSYGLCIPSNLVSKVLHDFEKFKEVRWRAINVGASLSEDGSVVVAKDVDPEGAAGKAGVKSGDKMISILTTNSHPAAVRIETPDDLISELAVLNGDDATVELVVERDGKKIPIEIKTNYKTSKDY